MNPIEPLRDRLTNNPTTATAARSLDGDSAGAGFNSLLHSANTAPPSDSELNAIDRLHSQLVVEAENSGVLDLAYTSVDTPIGSLLLVGSVRGLVRVAFDNEDHDAILVALGARLSPRILRAPARFDDVRRQLDEYFELDRMSFDIPLDLALSTGFRLLVQKHLPAIAYGHTESYKQVADAVGNPKAVRAVGTACATNPLPIVVPCHRVLRTDGKLGGYAGGLERKAALLALESAGSNRRSDAG